MIESVDLARKTTLGTGGPAAYFVEATTADDVRAALDFAGEAGIPLATIGLGSNLLVADEGFPGVVVRLTADLAGVSVEGTTLRAGGGASLAVCLHRAREAALGGFEFACAIPGTVGGGIWMNAGAYGGDIAGVLRRALVLDAGGLSWLGVEELGLEYRRSSLRTGRSCSRREFALSPAPEKAIRATVAEMQAARKASQPTNRRTFGSVFKNPRDDLGAGGDRRGRPAWAPIGRSADLAQARELHRECGWRNDGRRTLPHPARARSGARGARPAPRDRGGIPRPPSDGRLWPPDELVRPDV